jgi:hypothetical protein
MNQIKSVFMYVLALVVLLAPAILIGWIGFSLLNWWGGIIGVIVGLIIFGFSINKIAAQTDGEEAETPAELADEVSTAAKH